MCLVMKSGEERVQSIALTAVYCWLLVFITRRITKRRRHLGRFGKIERARNAEKYLRHKTIQSIAQVNVGEMYVLDSAEQNAPCIIVGNAERDSLEAKGQRIH